LILKRLLVGVSAFALASCTSPSNAALFSSNGRGSSPPPATCPNQGAGYADGCLTATHTGLIQDSSHFTNTANFNGNTPAARPPWDVPYVDYAIGQYTATGSLADPTNNSNLPPSCSYSSSDHVINCTGSGSTSITITGLYFNNSMIYFHSGYSSITIVGNKFTNGAAVASNFYQIRIDDQAASVDVEWNTIDELLTTVTPFSATVSDNRTTAHGALGSTYKYNAVQNIVGKFIIQVGCQSPTIKYNAYLGFPAPAGDGNHAEVGLFCFDASGTLALFDDEFNFAFLPATMDNTAINDGGATTVDYFSSGQNTSATWTHTIASYNYYNTNLNNNISLGTSPTKVQAASAFFFQQATFTTVDMQENWIFPHGNFFCMTTSSSPITTLNMTGNRNMWDNSTIPDFTASNCAGHS